MMWALVLAYVAAFAAMGSLAGIAVGAVARGRAWPARRLAWWASSAFCGLLVLGGVVQQAWRLPYPPQLLAADGHSFLATGMVAGLFCLGNWLALRLARRE